MKLVLFTPALKNSAIGRMVSLVTHAIVSQGHEVLVVRSESEALLGSAIHNFNAESVSWTERRFVADAIADADAVVYHVGDNPLFHQGALEWLPQVPGIVCLHDFYLAHLFQGWAEDHRDQAIAVLRSWYGEDAVSNFYKYAATDKFIEETRYRSPMTEWICSMAHGVITHSHWGTDRVLSSCPGPVEVVPLAYNAPGRDAIKTTASSHPSMPFRVLTVGHINPNKRVGSVIRAIGTSPLLADRSVYRLVGHIQPVMERELRNLASEYHVNLIISGEADDAALIDAIAQADVVSCLRWPSLEAASASAIEAMLYGKPIVVTDTGFYREIPNSCALKIDPMDEVNSLQSALETLCKDSDFRTTLASNCQRWAEETFQPNAYAYKLLEMATSIRQAGPTIAAIEHFSSLVHRWGGSKDLVELDDTISPLRLFRNFKRQ